MKFFHKTIFFILMLLGSNSLWASDSIKITFINPSHPTQPFWSSVTDFMQAAADDLGIKLKVLYASKSSDINRFEYINLFKQEANSPDKPDFMITHFRKSKAKEILKIAEEADVKTFIFNTQVPADEKSAVGLPREKYKGWIGHIFPNDTLAGYDLAEVLMNAGKEKGLLNSNGKLSAVGLSGNRHSVAALNRNKGLIKAINKNEQTLHQILFAKWQRTIAESQTTQLMERYPDTKIVWAANDTIALGVMDAIKKAGKTPGQDVLSGGFDWDIDALKAIQAGKMTASAGGHFMEGGWAMVMLHDYVNGNDFVKNNVLQIESKLVMIDQTNVGFYLKNFKDKDWSKIDFKKFSKTYNPKMKEYNFSLEAILRQFKG